MRQQIKKKIHLQYSNTIQNLKNISQIQQDSRSKTQKQYLSSCRTILNCFQTHAKTLKLMR